MIDILCLNFSDCSLKQSPHNPLTSYASYLKELYTSTCMSQSHTSQHWAHLPRCDFIQLAMIKDEQLRRGGPEEEMIRLAQQGKIETILSHKESIDLDDLFPLLPRSPQPLVVLPPPPPGRVCLIEGAPRGGKSTFVLHICHQWAQGASWLAQFDVVILAYLRDEAVQNASTLADIIPARNTEMSQSTTSQLQANDGMNALFIFDGWDEFPPNKMKSSLVSTILRQPHKLSLHQSTVLITSRPVATGNLLHIADRRVEILGFTHEQIHEFIEQALDGNRTQIQKLAQHLEEHPVIEGYCYIPLHSAILVHIFLTMKGALPTTRHELFCSLVLCCIVREQETHEPDTILPVMSSLNDLPDDLKSKLSNLCLLAYNGVMQEKIIFCLEDLLTSDINLPSLGLLQATEGLALCSKSLSYNFLHLSVQELLAAYHISQMDSSEQIRVFKNMFGSPRFQAVLQYYCGFTKLDNPEIQQFISSYHRSMSRLHDLLPILHCFFEAKQPSLTQLVDPIRFMSYGHFNSHPFYDLELTPVDLLAVGYFIVSFLFSCEQESNTNSTPTLYLRIDQPLDDHCLRLLLNEISKNPFGGEMPTSVGAFSEKLVLQLCNPSIKGLKYIVSYLKRFPLINGLALKTVDTWSALQDFIAEMLHIKIVTKLSIKNASSLKFSAIVKIKCVYYKPLTELDLSSLLEVEVCGIFEHLQHYSTTTLVNLNLSNTDITADTAQSLVKILQVNRSLTHLNFENLNNFSDFGAYCIFKGLQHNTSLIKLNLTNCDITVTNLGTARLLSTMLRDNNNSLTHLNLSGNNNFSDSGAQCIFESLQHNSTLVYLNLSMTTITATDSDTARSLTEMLQVNKSLRQLNLSGNNWFSDLGAQCIFESLQHNSTLVYLNLSMTTITATDPDTARSLTEMLQVNNSLTHLDLSCRDTVPENHIISLIFSALEHNTTLLHLVLRGRQILKDDAERIAKTLKSNKSLLTIDISRAYISRVDIILGELKFNTALKKIYITYNRAVDVAVSDLHKARKESGLPPIDIEFKI